MIDIQKMKKDLDDEIYGMESVKQNILTIIYSRMQMQNKRNILAIEGPPGIGKT